MVSVAC
ncbi:hypothetical protein ECEC4013_2053, partial [Escherichia coli EC4013]